MVCSAISDSRIIPKSNSARARSRSASTAKRPVRSISSRGHPPPALLPSVALPSVRALRSTRPPAMRPVILGRSPPVLRSADRVMDVSSSARVASMICATPSGVIAMGPFSAIRSRPNPAGKVTAATPAAVVIGVRSVISAFTSPARLNGASISAPR